MKNYIYNQKSYFDYHKPKQIMKAFPYQAIV